MGRFIDFKDFTPYGVSNKKIEQASKNKNMMNRIFDISECENEFKLTLNILVHNHPGKESFSLKEIVEKLGVGEEFIRRRIKSGKIKATYLGDKPFISIVELARIITEGV